MERLDCIQAKIQPVGIDFNATCSRSGIENIEARAERVEIGIRIKITPTCFNGEIESLYIPFLVKEGMFVLSDGSIFKVLKV